MPEQVVEEVKVEEKAPDQVMAEKLRAVEAERDKAENELSTLYKRIDELEKRDKEREAKMVLEKAVAAGKLTADAIVAAGTPWTELAMVDVNLAQRIIDAIPAKVGNVTERVSIKSGMEKMPANDEDAKLSAARRIAKEQNISLYEALEKMGD